MHTRKSRNNIVKLLEIATQYGQDFVKESMYLKV